MQINNSRSYLFIKLKTFSITAALVFALQMPVFCQPINNNCSAASPVSISNSGFGLGVFQSATFDLTAATVEPGETFAPAILVAGQNQKSMWYKFTLPTTRSVRVTLAQPGSLITAGDAGFAVYKTNTCLPSGTDISNKLTPIGLFGNTFHPCVESGDYLVQVSGKAAANGPIYITVETGLSTAAYDQPAQAFNFGTITSLFYQPDFTVDCQSIDDASEVCSSLANYQDYNKSTWHVFTTPAYFDYIAITEGINVGVKFGIKIYQGDVRSTPYNSLPVVLNCDSLERIGSSSATKIFGCNELSPNTTYSIQLFYHKSFTGQVGLKLEIEGSAPTIAPEPILSAIAPTTNNMGVLAAPPTGIGTARNDVLACNSRHSLHPCNPALPATGVLYNGSRYTMSTFFLFTLSGTSTLSISVGGPTGSHNGLCGPPFYSRLYKQGVSNSCSTLDTANIIGNFISGGNFTCLPPGNYTLQVMGQDTAIYNSGYPYCQKSNLGTKINLNINARSVTASNKFSLSSPGAFDTLNNVSNVMQPMVPGVTYSSKIDTFGCANTVRPLDIDCSTAATKAMYREFNVADSGLLRFYTNSTTNTSFKIYKGDANALAIAQTAFSYPTTITGLTPQINCMPSNPGGVMYDGRRTCVIPGTYTQVNYGTSSIIGETHTFQAIFDTLNTIHYNLARAEDLGDILSIIPPTGGTVTSTADYFSCKDNAIVIDGIQPCKEGYGVITATKAIYRQFYLSSAASIAISSQGVNGGNTTFSLFKGKATDGLAALTAMPSQYRCVASFSGSVCNPLPAGWYTVISYGWGPSYANPFRDLNSLNGNYTQYSGMVGYGNKIAITLNVSNCPKPKYNRPYKAAIDTITHQPFLIQWGARSGSTPAYPRTDTTYTLYTENFLCEDTPFISHPIQNCDNTVTKVAYYVFRTTQESFVNITTSNYWAYYGFAYRAAVYAGDVRTDSALFATTPPIQPCIETVSQIQLCKLQPGTYTIAVFAPPGASCNSVTPSIYIDQVGYSRFDHANNSYDFGLIPPDSVYHDRKAGDVNPLNAGRAPSNDFFYCTTGSQPNDPAYGGSSQYLSSIYNPGNNNPLYPTPGYYGYFGNIPTTPRRNLWYTFTIDKGGTVRVKVKNKTPGKTDQYPYVVMKSDVNGNLPFSTVVSSGAVDSTSAQGLGGVTGNVTNYGTFEEVSFYREPCSPITERYYIVVQTSMNEPGMLPNHQVEVSVLFDSVNAIQPQFDHYYQANNIGNNLGPGIYTGATDNFSCATRDATDPSWNPNSDPSICLKTLWYKFSTTVSGVIRPLFNIDGAWLYGSPYGQLYRQTIPGDSTANGLKVMDFYNNNWECCISPGTYYILMPNCGLVGGNEYPRIELIENAGDYCSRPVIASLNGAGSWVSSVLVNCHTIGTDYGEFNPTLTCPAGAVTNQYKTSWFKITITGTDTLDVTTFLTENTNASSSQIKYRLMNGNCGAMQERSCVQDALTQDTYKCLAPGDYWIQVFTPVLVGTTPVTGTIDLHLNAVHHVDTCAPINPCLSNANFQKQFDCTQSMAVQFINYSTYGSSVSYLWNFGYNGQTSTAVSPQFIYPALTVSQKYYITLTVTNNSCGGVSSYLDSIVIPARSVVNLGADTSSCNGTPVLLNATSHPGSTYLWSTGAVTPTYLVITPGQLNYSVVVTYNGCLARDTIKVNIDTINSRKVNKYICGINSVVLDASRGAGEAHLWNTGATSSSITVFAAGIYWDNISLRGCTARDSFIVSSTAYPLGNDRQACFGTQPVILNATTAGATGYTWQNGSTAATFTAPAAGLYWVDISFGNCNLRDTIVLTNLQPVFGNSNATICQGQAYTLPSGTVVNAAGIYSDTVRSVGGCDSLINSINLIVQAAIVNTTNAAICPGQTYTLPWGTVVNATGIYRDTLRYVISNCDSIRRVVNLTVQTSLSTTTNATICSGQTYTLPWGAVVSTAGVYRDTLRYVITNCDSLRRTVNLTVQTSLSSTTNATICAGQTYTLPWGAVVNTAGVYRDTIRYTITNCDSLRRTVNLTVQTTIISVSNPTVCSGQSYVLPWGTVVNTTGVYRDTLRYTITNCDSLYRVVNLTVQPAPSSISNAIICSGQNYTLPWGTVVNTAGVYRDTLKYVNSGCDSIYRVVNLTVQTSLASTTNATICAGQTYTLPWGTVVNTSGVYRDTLRYAVTNCDSLRRTVNLIVQTALSSTTNATICSGQTYTLPWGTVINAAGVYKDTLRYTVTNCDSLRRTVNLTVQAALSSTTNATLCSGQTYTLPWGTVVNATGVYRDTLRYSITNCDSLRRTVNLTVQVALSSTANATICAGQTYMLPWGTVVNTSGVYKDTLRYAVTNCDSLRRTVNLTVQTSQTTTTNATICAGQTYTLPWGTVVNAAGVYKDTLHYAITNCDSVRRTVNLAVQAALSSSTNATICAGQTYTLPWGTVVNTNGVYKDTLRYSITNCDSLRRTVNLTVQTALSSTTNATICAGQTYSLPWGPVVNATGVYSDTLHYSVTNCDSIRRNVNLIVQAVSTSSTNATICAGNTYTLPWGAVVNTAGIYKDTLHYIITNCDSLIRIVNLSVTPAAVSNITASICSGENYILPWGAVASIAGLYKDTVRTSFGCDSLIRAVTLIVKPLPVLTVAKSNDINCIIGISKLYASGALNYLWSPTGSLSNAVVNNPVASPVVTTMYHVQATAGNGCVKEDSILVRVNKTDIENGFQLPTAFTPNGDGLNDCFGVKSWGNVSNLKFEIYSRWGELVFTTTNPSQCWDGRYKGVLQSHAVFIYQIWADTFCGKIYRKGAITLIR